MPQTALNRPPWLFLLPLKQFSENSQKNPTVRALLCSDAPDQPGRDRARREQHALVCQPPIPGAQTHVDHPRRERERGSRGMSLSGRCVQECPLCMECVAAKRACVVIARHCAPTKHARAAPRTTSRAPRWLPQSDPSIQFSPSSVLQALKCHARSRWAEQAEGSAADQR